MNPDAASEVHWLQRVADACRCEPRALRLVRCTSGRFNTTYFVEGAARPLVLRIAPVHDPASVLFYEHRMMRQEPALHARLRSETSVPVAEIVFDGTAADADLPAYLVMERLPGMPLSSRAQTPAAQTEALTALGRCLRQVHGLRGAQFGYLGPHAPMTPQSDWFAAFTIMWRKLLDDIVRCGGYHSGEANFLRRLLDRHRRRFDRPAPAALLHMDVWNQNILIDGQGHLTGLLDWDRALWGDPELEFAVLDYCGISEPPFWEGYGAERDTSPDARVRGVFYLLYELQKYIFIRRVRGQDPGRADGYRRRALALAQELTR